jgi:hypothetical protein
MTHIKKYVDNLPETVDMHDVNGRLQLLEKVWEEYNAVQDQLWVAYATHSTLKPVPTLPR